MRIYRRSKRKNPYRTLAGAQRAKITKECEDYLRKILRHERGEKCEICGKKSGKVGLFHILPKGRYPNIRFNKFNLLLACWFPCHFFFHHDPFKARKILDRIKELRGPDFEDKLKIISRMEGKMSICKLTMYRESLKKEIERIGV